MNTKYPNVKVKLVGTDGNAFAVLGKCLGQMRKAGLTQKQQNEFSEEVMSGDYDHLIQTAMKYFEVS